MDAETLRLCLRGWANQMAARFSAPVYLVGSALDDPNARDIDVRIVLADEVFEARYGSVVDFIVEGWSPEWGEGRKRWGVDMAKLSRNALVEGGRALHLLAGRDLIPETRWTEWGVNLDFQVQAASVAEPYADRPRERLDALDLSGVA